MACEPNSASTTIIKTVDTSFDAAIVDQHIKRGNRAFALRQYEEAVQEYGQASQLLGEHFGQDAPECADVLTLYGKALLHNAIQQNGVLGSQAGRATVDEEAHPSAAPMLSKILQFLDESEANEGQEEVEHIEAEARPDQGTSKGKEKEEENVEDEEEEDVDEEDEEDEEEETVDDFAMAWEILDLARVIYSRQHDQQAKEKLGDVYMLLGDVSLESENFEQAIQDYSEAVRIKSELYSNDDRRLAEAYYKYALSFEYSNKREQAIEQLEAVAGVLRRRLKVLRQKEEEDAVQMGKGKQPADPDMEPSGGDANQAEIADLQDLMTDIESKIEDLRQKSVSVLQAVQDGPIGGDLARQSLPSGPVNDLTSLVRSTKKKNAEAAAKRKNEEADTTTETASEVKRAKCDTE